MRSAVLPALAGLCALALSGCVSSSNPSATRAAALANLVARARPCRAGAPRATTLDQFLAAERGRGATAEQIAGARSTYVTVSEAQMINQAQRPERCEAAERSTLRTRMNAVRAGQFDAF